MSASVADETAVVAQHVADVRGTFRRPEAVEERAVIALARVRSRPHAGRWPERRAGAHPLGAPSRRRPVDGVARDALAPDHQWSCSWSTRADRGRALRTECHRDELRGVDMPCAFQRRNDRCGWSSVSARCVLCNTLLHPRGSTTGFARPEFISFPTRAVNLSDVRSYRASCCGARTTLCIDAASPQRAFTETAPPARR